MSLDRGNVQGLVTHGYGYPLSRHLLLHFPDQKAGRSFLRWARPQITTGIWWERGTRPEPLLNLGLTYPGLVAIGIADVLAKINPNLVLDPEAKFPRIFPFPGTFAAPPDPMDLGDGSPQNAPRGWWNARFSTEQIHASLHLYAQTDGALSAIVAGARAAATSTGVQELVANADGSPLGGPALPGRRVHFGYVDGAGQPQVDWENDLPEANKVDRRNFLLGYDGGPMPSLPDKKHTGDLFLNGCYMALRWASQDVPAFEKLLDDSAALVASPGMPNAQARSLLAAKLIGRWPGGAPLVLAPGADDPSVSKANSFNFKGVDDDGLRCPFSAHIRVTNPRDQPLNAVVQRVVPRIIRRGTPYGPEWIPGKNDNADRGLLGLFLCASLDHQFLQLMRWMNRNDFSPAFDNDTRRRQDPLATDRGWVGDPPFFRVPVPGGFVELPITKPLVQSRGTAYLLIPGISTLDRLLA